MIPNLFYYCINQVYLIWKGYTSRVTNLSVYPWLNVKIKNNICMYDFRLHNWTNSSMLSLKSELFVVVTCEWPLTTGWSRGKYRVTIKKFDISYRVIKFLQKNRNVINYNFISIYFYNLEFIYKSLLGCYPRNSLELFLSPAVFTRIVFFYYIASKYFKKPYPFFRVGSYSILKTSLEL